MLESYFSFERLEGQSREEKVGCIEITDDPDIIHFNVEEQQPNDDNEMLKYV